MSPTTYKIKSPLMGTFYSAPGPGENPYVEVGQQVNVSDIVCVIESMKVFTELKTDKRGFIKTIMVEDEEPVMKNQDLKVSI